VIKHELVCPHGTCSPHMCAVSLTRTCVLQRYVEEQVQRTGVALETQGISFITTGKKRDSLTVRISLVTPLHTPLLCTYVGSFSSGML